MSRPTASEEKREQRSCQLLDAAFSLWQEHPQRVASVAEVAQRAGVAKGTIYLYFKSKEDLLLAVHERHVMAFFAAFQERAASAQMDFDDVMALTKVHFVDQPVTLPLATLVGGLMHKGVTPEAAEAFEQRLSECLRMAGSMLCRHFPLKSELDGVRLFMRSYALIIGLWQMLGSEQRMCVSGQLTAMMLPDYASELDAALKALWKGTLDEDQS